MGQIFGRVSERLEQMIALLPAVFIFSRSERGGNRSPRTNEGKTTTLGENIKANYGPIYSAN